MARCTLHVYDLPMRPIVTPSRSRSARADARGRDAHRSHRARGAGRRAAAACWPKTIAADADVPPFVARGDGRLRGARRGHARRQRARRRRPCARSTSSSPVQAPRRPLAAGECAEIATGAPVPDGADAVVMVEETDERTVEPARRRHRFDGGQARPERAAAAPTSRPARQLLAPGDLLTPSRLGVCAAAGRSHVVVYARPVVAIVSTGNEIVEPGQPLGPAQIYDINRFTLSAVDRGARRRARVLPDRAGRPAGAHGDARRSDAARRTSSCSREAAPSASAISCSTRCGSAAR